MRTRALPRPGRALRAPRAVVEALVSVRAERLEPSEVGMRVLQAIASGQLSEDEAVEFLRERRRALLDHLVHRR